MRIISPTEPATSPTFEIAASEPPAAIAGGLRLTLISRRFFAKTNDREAFLPANSTTRPSSLAASPTIDGELSTSTAVDWALSTAEAGKWHMHGILSLATGRHVPVQNPCL